MLQFAKHVRYRIPLRRDSQVRQTERLSRIAKARFTVRCAAKMNKSMFDCGDELSTGLTVFLTVLNLLMPQYLSSRANTL